jgi:hypothetical protein
MLTGEALEARKAALEHDRDAALATLRQAQNDLLALGGALMQVDWDLEQCNEAEHPALALMLDEDDLLDTVAGTD